MADIYYSLGPKNTPYIMKRITFHRNHNATGGGGGNTGNETTNQETGEEKVAENQENVENTTGPAMNEQETNPEAEKSDESNHAKGEDEHGSTDDGYSDDR